MFYVRDFRLWRISDLKSGLEADCYPWDSLRILLVGGPEQGLWKSTNEVGIRASNLFCICVVGPSNCL